MKVWKSAWELAKYELQASALQLLLCWLLLSVLGLLFLTSFNNYMTKNYFGFDMMFIFLFSFGPYLCKGHHFHYKKMFNRVWASPVLFMQLQLPIPLNILVRSRLLIYLGYFIPFYCFTLIMMYMMNGTLNSLLNLYQFLIFLFVWFALSLLIGSVLPASDVGDVVTSKVMIKSFFIVILGILIPFGLFYGIFHVGIVAWILHIVITTPLLAIGFSILILISIALFWPHYMKKTIQKIDYM